MFFLTYCLEASIFKVLLTPTKKKKSEYSVPICTILLSKAGSFKKSDLSVSVQVLLVSAQDDNDVLTGQHSGITQPCGQSIVRLSAANSKAAL